MFGLLKKPNPIEQPTKLFEPRKRPNTPDAVRLEKFSFQFLFTPDELASNQPGNERLGGGSVRLCTAYSREKYQLFKHVRLTSPDTEDYEPYPIGIPLEDTRSHAERNRLVFPGDSNFYAKMRGELHIVRPYTLFKLDTYKENLVQFKRKRVHIVIPYIEEGVNRNGEAFRTGEKVYILVAWMYVGVREYWNKHLDAGFRFKKAGVFSSKRRWLKEYYDFNDKGYQSSSRKKTVP